MNTPPCTRLEFGEYLCTREGDRLSTLAAGYRMSFSEKVRWSETCHELAKRAGKARARGLRNALETWAD